MKKLISLFLALALCLGMGAAALADGGVELPDAAEFLSDWLEDYGVTVRLVKQTQSGAIIGVENVQDTWTMLNKAANGVDLMLQLYHFELISNLDPVGWMQTGDAEFLYAYTGSASVGTLDYSANDRQSSVYVYVTDDNDLVDGVAVEITVADGITMLSSGTGAVTETAAETAAETDVSGSGDNILPDAWAFFNEEVTHSDKLIPNGRRSAFFLDENAAPACYEYMDLLMSGRFGVTLTDTWEKSNGGSRTVYYLFDYPGAGPEREVSTSFNNQDVSADMTVEIDDWGNVGWCHMFIRFSDALTVVDTGDRSTVTGLRNWGNTKSTGPMGSAISESDDSSSEGGGSYYDDDDDDIFSYGSERKKCNYCNGYGSRDCLTCGGKGYIEEYVSVPNYSGSTLGPMGGWEHHDCPNFNCHNGQVDCSFCGGDGWID